MVKLCVQLGAITPIVDQEAIPEFPTSTGKVEDGSYRLIETGKKTLLPNYLVQMDNLESENIGSLSEIARNASVSGDFEFSDPLDAKLLTRKLRLETRLATIGAKCSFNQIAKPSSSTVEGYKSDDSNHYLQTSPDSLGFWFTAPYWYGAYYGSNICAPTNSGSHVSSNLWDYSSGAGIMVAVIDGGFQGGNESSMPGSILGTHGSYYSYSFVANTYSIQGAVNADTKVPWHGREVASMIFSPHGDSLGTVGTASAATPILMHTDNTDWQHGSAIDTARNWGAKVVNMSYSEAAPFYDGCSSFRTTVRVRNGAVFGDQAA